MFILWKNSRFAVNLVIGFIKYFIYRIPLINGHPHLKCGPVLPLDKIEDENICLVQDHRDNSNRMPIKRHHRLNLTNIVTRIILLLEYALHIKKSLMRILDSTEDSTLICAHSIIS